MVEYEFLLEYALALEGLGLEFVVQTRQSPAYLEYVVVVVVIATSIVAQAKKIHIRNLYI